MEIKSYIVDLICFFCFFDSLQAKAYWETLLGSWGVAPLQRLASYNREVAKFAYKKRKTEKIFI